MASNQPEPRSPELDSILEEFVASLHEPDHAQLTEWVKRYPQYEQQLTDFAANWSVV
jgi:hypothetical protein